MPRKAVMLILSFLALLVLGVLFTSAFVALPVPFSLDRANQYLHERYPLYDIDFTDPTMIWRLDERAVELRLRNVVVTGPAGDQVASVPDVVLAIDPIALLSGRLAMRSVLLFDPVFRLERTAGGALRIDIGPSSDGASGPAVIMLLTDIITASEGAGGRAGILETRITNGMLHVSDELSGARFTFDIRAATLARVDHGAELQAVLSAVTSGELIKLDLQGLFRSADRSVTLNAGFHNVNPAILSDLLPYLPALAPVEIPLGGKVEAHFDQGLALQSARFDIVGQAGSLEIAQYTGRNITVDGVQAVVRYTHETRRLRLDNLSLVFQGKRLTGTMQSTDVGNGLRVLSADLILSGTSWDAVAPLWFAAVDRWKTDATLNTRTDTQSQRLSYLARVYKAHNVLEGRGRLLLQRSTPTQAGEKTAAQPVDFTIGGTPASPEFVLFAP